MNPYRMRGLVQDQSFTRRAKRPRASYFVHDSLEVPVPNPPLAEQTLGPDQEYRYDERHQHTGRLGDKRE